MANSQEKKNKHNYQLAIVGDVFLKTKSNDKSPFSGQISEFLKTIPCAILNLETVLSPIIQSKEKAVTLYTNPDNVNYLNEIGIKAVNLANNHVFDQGKDGFYSTISILDNAGINYFGVIKDGKQQPYILEVDGNNIGFLGYSLESGERLEGVAPINLNLIRDDINSLKLVNVNRIIVNLHWGEEYVFYPSPIQQKMAREIIDMGTDVIIGHHPHVVQGIEEYKHGVIFYSIGNFNFPNFGDFIGTRWGLIALLRFNKSNIDYSYLPIKIDSEFSPYFPPEVFSGAFQEYVKNISKKITPKISSFFWFKDASIIHFQNHMPSFIYRIRKYGFLHLLQMVRWLISPSNYGYYLGLVFRLIHYFLRRGDEVRYPFSKIEDERYP